MQNKEIEKLNVPRNTHAIILKKLLQFNSQRLKGFYDFHSFYFCLQIICASFPDKFKLNNEEIQYRNLLFKEYTSGALKRALNKIKNLEFEDDEIKNKTLKLFFVDERMPIIIELKKIVDADMKKIINPYLQLTYCIPQNEKTKADFGLWIIGAFKDAWDI